MQNSTLKKLKHPTITIHTTDNFEIDESEVTALLADKCPFKIRNKRSTVSVGFANGMSLAFQPEAITPEHLQILAYLSGHLHIEVVRDLMLAAVE